MAREASTTLRPIIYHLTRAIQMVNSGKCDDDLNMLYTQHERLRCALDMAHCRKTWKTPEFRSELGLETTMAMSPNPNGEGDESRTIYNLAITRDNTPVATLSGSIDHSVWEKHEEMRTNTRLTLTVSGADMDPFTWKLSFYGSIFDNNGDSESTAEMVDFIRSLGVGDILALMTWIAEVMNVPEIHKYQEQVDAAFEEYLDVDE